MKLRRIPCLATLGGVLLMGSLASAQPARFAEVESIPLGGSGLAKAGSGEVNFSAGVSRRASIVMETKAHMHADGTISTTCAAIRSDVPHSLSATQPVGKLPQRER